MSDGRGSKGRRLMVLSKELSNEKLTIDQIHKYLNYVYSLEALGRHHFGDMTPDPDVVAVRHAILNTLTMPDESTERSAGTFYAVYYRPDDSYVVDTNQHPNAPPRLYASIDGANRRVREERKQWNWGHKSYLEAKERGGYIGTWHKKTPWNARDWEIHEFSLQVNNIHSVG